MTPLEAANSEIEVLGREIVRLNDSLNRMTIERDAFKREHRATVKALVESRTAVLRLRGDKDERATQ